MATNNSNIPAWMSEPWQMTTMNGSSLATTFSVGFDTSDPLNVKVVFHDGSSTYWGILSASSVTSNAVSVSGVTASGQPFQIDYTSGTLQCRLDDTSTQGRLQAGGRGRTAVTSSPQAMARVVASQEVGGGSTPATTSPLAAARIIDSQYGGGGSTPTWVASDGGSNRIGKPGPYPMVKATPDAVRA
jgi:hypothetical protein